MTWYYASGGQQLGPVDEAALDDLVRQGVVRDETLIWKSGMAGWQPHGTVRPRAAVPVPAPAAAPLQAAPMNSPAAQPAVETRYCSECGRPHPANQLYTMGTAAVCASCYPAYMQRTSMPQGGAQMPQTGSAMQPMGAPMQQMGAPHMGMPMQMAGGGRWRFGGFWIRFLARIIDGILVGIVSTIIRLPLAMLMGGGAILSGIGRDSDPSAALAALPMIFGLMGVSFLIQIALGLVYEVYFLTTRGATVGKMALGLRVVTAEGGPISIGLAAGRFFASYLSGMILLIGYIMAGFDLEKRSLHDRICNTRVIYTR
jgi:uncharacterized RDD family membrane protein YckC